MNRHVYEFSVHKNDKLTWPSTGRAMSHIVGSFIARDRAAAWDAAEGCAARTGGHQLFDRTGQRLLGHLYAEALEGFDAHPQFIAHFGARLDAGEVIDLCANDEWWKGCSLDCCAGVPA